MIALAPSVGAALLALALAAVVAGRGVRGPAGASFAVAMGGLAVTQAGYALALHGGGSTAGLAISAAAELVALPAWVVFGIAFGAAEAWIQVRRWRWVIGLVGAVALGLLLGALALPVVEPAPVLRLTPLGRGVSTFALLASVLVLFHLESTLRGTAGSVRGRIKHFVLALLGVFAVNVFGLSQQLLYDQIFAERLPLQSAMTLLSLALMAFGLLRHRVLAVDVFISRQAVYSFVAVGAVGAYLLGLGLTSELLTHLGVELDLFVSALVVFATAMALVVGLLSETVRRWARRIISTHFYRSHYDYRREWAAFTAHVAPGGPPDGIPERILERITGTLGARTGALWLSGPAADWRLAAAVGSQETLRGLDVRALTGAASSGPGGPAPTPVAQAPWARAIPLQVESEVCGLLVVGPPPGGRFTAEDDDILTTFATQAATVLLNARLTEQLARARELEALHRVSTFVLHDLKNCVAMLSLVARNAEQHGQDPEFQRDAFRAVAESVRQMQDLMGKLADPPPPFRGSTATCRLNKRIEEIVARVRTGPRGPVDIRTALDSAADQVAVADEAVCTIVSNLLVNAVEALEEAGQVEVRTSREGSRITLTVADTGVGMSEDFVREQLFVPLRTTKAHGLGVGLYQVKTVVAAVGGRIRVESRPGGGSTFWVDLPAEVDGR